MSSLIDNGKKEFGEKSTVEWVRMQPNAAGCYICPECLRSWECKSKNDTPLKEVCCGCDGRFRIDGVVTVEVVQLNLRASDPGRFCC